jgi:hypothetical protein
MLSSFRMLVGALGIENSTILPKPHKQRRCNRSYTDNHYKYYKLTDRSSRVCIVVKQTTRAWLLHRDAPKDLFAARFIGSEHWVVTAVTPDKTSAPRVQTSL